METSDLGPVPDLLRAILEDTLSQEASPQSLDQYLPKIRDIIINLLQGLKKKQAKLRNRSGPDEAAGGSSQPPMRQSSGSGKFGDAEMTQPPEEMPVQETRNQMETRYGGDNMGREQPSNSRSSTTPERPQQSERDTLRRDSRSNQASTPSSSLSSTTMQSMPVISPYSEPERRNIPAGFPPPPPPPKQEDALTALQRGGDLERRASRRFSAYQISKHLGASPNGMGVLPPTQNGPVPNRGRDMRESMNAVRSRGSLRQSQQKSSSRLASPSRAAQTSEKIEEEVTEERPAPKIVPPVDVGRAPPTDSPMAKTPEDKYRPIASTSNGDLPSMGATINGPMPNLPEPTGAPDPPAFEPTKKDQTQEADVPRRTHTSNATVSTPPQSRQFTPEDSPPPGKDLTLFLQYKSKIKKFVLTNGYDELTLARLQLAFIEKFAWNTHNNGVDLPEIYIQDPVSGIRHELEDINDVKDRCVLVLNVEVLDEVKKHIDDGLGGIKELIEGVRGTIQNQEALMQRFSDRQLETSKDMARIAAAPPPPPSVPVTSSASSSGKRPSISSASTLTEVQSLRRDLAIIRQSYTNLASEFTASMQNIKAKGALVQKLAADTAIPAFSGDAGRLHVENGVKELQVDSENLVNRVDEISDLVEDLRKDVVTRGVRPLPRQLEGTSRDISTTVKELMRLKEFLKREKPIWTKIWEKELEFVCQAREEFTQQEELMVDLSGDLEQISDIFKLVEEATLQQNLQPNTGAGNRNASRNLPIDPYVDPQQAKDGVLGEVRALQPNHESRLEAIERAEKARQRELESRKGGAFQREVEQFVEEGKLKKTGGAEEVERLRRAKDERARRENWDRAAARRAEMEERERQEALAAAQQQPPPQSESLENDDNSVVPDAADGQSVLGEGTVDGEGEPNDEPQPQDDGKEKPGEPGEF